MAHSIHPIPASSLIPACDRTVSGPVAVGPTLQPLPLLGLLAAAALTDWLVTRTLTRLAIFLPKSPLMISGYQALSWLGLLGSTLAALLVVVGSVRLVTVEWRQLGGKALALAAAGLVGLGLLFLVVPPGRWLVAYHLLALLCLALLGRRALLSHAVSRRVLLIPAAAMMCATLHQSAPALYGLLGWAGPATWGKPAFLVGEALVIAGAAALWWGYGRGASGRVRLLALLPALLFAVAYLGSPAMTATVVIWSNGLTLYLPWWLYAGALWLMTTAVLEQAYIGDGRTAAALLLLAAAGYAPQLNSQFLMGVLALWLLQLSPQLSPQHPT